MRNENQTIEKKAPVISGEKSTTLSEVTSRLITRLEKWGLVRIPTISGFDYTMAGKGVKILFLEERDGRTHLIFMDAVRCHTFYHSAKCAHEGHLEDAWNKAAKIREKFVRFEFMDYANIPMLSAFHTFIEYYGVEGTLEAINELKHQYTELVSAQDVYDYDDKLGYIMYVLQQMLMDAVKAEALQDSIEVYAARTENTPDAWTVDEGFMKGSAIDIIYEEDKAA